MNPSIISHRMFVAALSHEENGTAQDRQSDRASGKPAKDRAQREPSKTSGAARQLLFAAVTDGLQSAEA